TSSQELTEETEIVKIFLLSPLPPVQLPRPSSLHTPLPLNADSEHRSELLPRFHQSQTTAARKGAGRRSHRLERDVILVLRREDLRVRITCEEFHGDSAVASR